MTSRSERFRGLSPAPPADAQDPDATADLFEHYGVPVGPSVPANIVAAVEAAGCRRCGWWLALRRDAVACPICCDPDPLAVPPAKTKAKT